MIEKLILAGGGTKEDSIEADDYLVDQLRAKNSDSIAYIPIALEHQKYGDAFEWFNLVFLNRIKKTQMWEDLNNLSLEDMRKFGAIYIGGGNTIKLLQHIRSTGFDLRLKSYIAEGGIVYGGSAGAIILGKDVRTASETQITPLDDSRGLDVLGGYSVMCHYIPSEASRKTIMELSSLIHSPIICIPEKSGVVSTSSNLTVVGSKDVDIYQNNNVRTLFPHQNIDYNT